MITNLGCGLYTGAAYTPISKTFLLIFEGCGLYTGAAYTPEITVLLKASAFTVENVCLLYIPFLLVKKKLQHQMSYRYLQKSEKVMNNTS